MCPFLRPAFFKMQQLSPTSAFSADHVDGLGFNGFEGTSFCFRSDVGVPRKHPAGNMAADLHDSFFASTGFTKFGYYCMPEIVQPNFDARLL